MARKKRGFQWTREDQEDEQTVPVERSSRVKEKARTRELEKLARRLTAMSPGERRQLPLESHVLEEIAVLAKLGPKSSRRRQLLYVQRLLRASDLEAIEAALAERGLG